MISYIIPSFNQGAFIQYTIDSVLANMDGDDELIIADGASTDNTGEVVTPYLKDPRIVYFSEPDKGFSDALGKALRCVRNPIIGIMSSDDAYAPNIRKRVLKCFEDINIDLVYADYEIIDLQNKRIGKRLHTAGSLEDILSLRILLPQSSVFFRLSALDVSNMLNLDHDYIADVVFFNQICLRGRFKFIPEIWSQVRKHPGSRTGKRNPGLQYLDAIDTALSSMPKKLKNKSVAGGHLLRARYEASSQNRFAALRSLTKGIMVDPFLLNHWLLPRTLAYIILGPGGVDYLMRLRKFIAS
jgi:glycosyltransferase involved in cell wall biosynthesis